MNTLSFNDLKGKVAVLTGGAGVIGSSLAEALSSLGVKLAIVDYQEDQAKALAAKIQSITGTASIGVGGNVLDKASLISAREQIHLAMGKIDFLINGAGGNNPAATTRAEFADPSGRVAWEDTFYGLDMEAFRSVFDLNFIGTLLATMVFTTDMRDSNKGAVINISSMNAFHPLTKIPAYSAAKASVNNFTEWLAVHLAKTGIRVNAIAPGFFLTNQNRFLLLEEQSGKLTARGHKILNATPMGRFGNPEELAGTVAFLLSDLAAFITGVVIPIDGGFNAYSGV
jgi:NAD(P)-dependent dehydrogenase (short-subunit alcohol dehydrogenase family)